MTSIRLAPMAGITDWPFRLLCYEQGCDMATTEMVSAMGYVYAPRNHPGTVSLIERHPDEPRLFVQIFGFEYRVFIQELSFVVVGCELFPALAVTDG